MHTKTTPHLAYLDPALEGLRIALVRAPGWYFVDGTHVKVHADGSNAIGGQASQSADSGQ
jgi:hypothetical protein